MKNREKESCQENDSRNRKASPSPNKRNRKVNNAPNKSNGTGLDLSLFEGHVPADTVCAFCRRVLVQPEVSSCQHVFCARCLRSHSGLDCPICGERLHETSQKPPTQLSLKLLNLRIHCDNKCGQVMLLGQLPQHVKEECPNAPVPCVYARKGCRMKVKRCELDTHSKECDWRPVQCEACGEKSAFRDLVAHQKRSQCVENRIKNQLIQAVRVTRLEEKHHKRSLDKQRVHMDLHQRRTELEHSKRLSTARVQRQIQQNYQLQRSYSQHFLRTASPSKQEHQLVLQSYGSSRHESTSRVDPITPRNHKEERQNSDQCDPVETKTTKDPADETLANTNGTVFVTHMVGSEDESTTTGAFDTMSREDTRMLVCKNCNKPFKRKRNRADSCRWHSGPIVDLFGGTCYTCGRLDYQTGCMVGFHDA